jgi:hypothetical protein
MFVEGLPILDHAAVTEPVDGGAVHDDRFDFGSSPNSEPRWVPRPVNRIATRSASETMSSSVM